MSLLDSAIAFAATAHAGQTRRYSGEPYVTHPIEVMMRLWDGGIRDEAMLIAAVLHDVVEDTTVTFDTIERRFMTDVAELVHELTDRYTKEKYPDLNRKVRKAYERERIANTSARAQTVKYADFISNTASIVKHDLGFARLYLAEKEAILKVARKGDAGLLHGAELALQWGQHELMQESLR